MAAREDWLNEAISLMGEHRDHGALKIDALCARLSLTKGSFYWHFKNHEALQLAVIEHWANHYQQQIHERLPDPALEAEPFLMALFSFWAGSEFSKADAAMRRWAATNEAAQESIEAADKLLFSLLITAFRKLGLPQESAHNTAYTMIALGVAAPSLGHLSPSAEGLQQLLIRTLESAAHEQAN